ncbi:hypothetical protein BSL78_07039 [Apostichopus japonicus]|uniref:Uncharacterized protein n=1 Tax=Stichopus japonicus TaxID=307972 RepID=A0A2G8L739_STIJA|nr:hypothetical protein BSL78_07039 [Apostichopus japonicus]
MLQVINGKFWGDVCYQDWTSENANVACKHLGYATAEGTHAMVATSRKEIFRGIYLQDVHCNGSENSLWECDNAVVGDYSSTCDSLHVVWLSCTNHESATDEITTVADETMEPSIQVVRITDSSVALDWQRWFSLAEQELPQEYVISFQVLFRPAGDPSMNFTIGAQVPGYFTYGTVEKLAARTQYEFKVEAMRLLFDRPGETAGPTSSVVTAITLCSGPKPVSSLTVEVESVNQLNVMWQSPIDEDCPPEYYIVEYKLISREHCEDGSEGGLDGTLRVVAPPALLTNLHAYSRYTVNVTVVNTYGRSSETQRLVETYEGVPRGTPLTITTEYHSSKDALVAMWAPPACGERNGEITGYTYMLLDVETDRVIDYGTTQLPIVHLLGWILCGVPNPEFATRIVGGEVTGKGAFPWMAQIWNVLRGTKYCAGSILDDHWILTAAHCIKMKNFTRKDIRIQLGDYDTQLPEPQQRSTTSPRYIHTLASTPTSSMTT